MFIFFRKSVMLNEEMQTLGQGLLEFLSVGEKCGEPNVSSAVNGVQRVVTPYDFVLTVPQVQIINTSELLQSTGVQFFW